MFVRYFIDLDDPFEHVEGALLADPSDWVPGMARAAGKLGDGLLAEVGFTVRDDLRIDKEVEIWIGEAHQASGRTRLPMSWKATGTGRLFPSLDGDLEVAVIGASRTQLAISAQYEPPLGSVGRALDRALFHRVAEATIKDFLERVAAAIEARIRVTVPE
jgi:hypothetical protein